MLLLLLLFILCLSTQALLEPRTTLPPSGAVLARGGSAALAAVLPRAQRVHCSGPN